MADPIYKQFASVRTAFLLALAALFLTLPPAALAQPNPAYTVEGVEVDVTAENAVKAREKALDEAQVKGYQMLAERFLGEDEMKTFKLPDPVSISALIQDYEVTKEQVSMTRYKGVYTVRFRPNALKAQMAAQGKVVTDMPKKPVLVLPFFQGEDQLVLWNETNPWMKAWRSLPADKTLNQAAVVPLGDAKDAGDIGDGDGLQYDPVRVQEMAERYGADDVAIVVASAEQTQSAQGRLILNVYNNGFDGPSLVQKITVDQMPDEQAAALFTRAAQKVKTLLRQNWKANGAYNPSATAAAPATTTTTVQTTTYGAPPSTSARPALGPATIYSTHATFASVQDWVRIKNTVDRVYGVQSVVIKALKPREALLDIRFSGNVNALQTALQNAGIALAAGQPGRPLELYLGGRSPGNPYYR